MNTRSFKTFHSVLILLVCSVVLLCSCNNDLVSADEDLSLTWTKSAAEEAEWAAAQHCSGHGFVFTDTFLRLNQTSKAICECNACFEGNTCPIKNSNCTADAASGDPTFMEPFWLRNAEDSATVAPGWYRMSYNINDRVDNLIFPELESLIKKLHALVGNAVTDNRYIVVGVGSVQLINAAVHSLAYSSSGYQNRALVVSPAPYYDAYQTQTEFFESIRYMWAGDSRQWANKTLNSTTKYIELVASPNNPDGFLQNGVLDGNLKNVKKVWDRAYYWPHYSPIKERADEDVVLFTLSKLTGHAGSRFGWAIVKDRSVYERMVNYISQSVIGISHDTQLRATNLLKSIIESYQNKDPSNGSEKNEEKIFDYAYSVMSSRWKKIEQAFQGSQRFSLQKLNSSYCNFFKRVRDPSPAYAWVKCLKDADCGGVFRREAGIIGRNGTIYGVDKSYVRFSLLKRNDAFDNLHNHLVRFLA